jgi:membrane fusion protein, multidrug efflux system
MSSPQRANRFVLVTGLCLTAMACWSGCGRKEASGSPDGTVASGDPPPAPQPASRAASSAGQWATVRRAPIRRYATAVGSLRATQTTRISSQVSGEVLAVNVDVGAAVRTGDVLVKLDPDFFQIEVEQMQASVQASRAAVDNKAADLKDKEREVQRQKELFDKGAGSKKERDDAATAYDRALAEHNEQKALLEHAEKALDYAQHRLDKAGIRAPYNGVITQRFVDPGESVAVTPATYLLEIQDVGTLYLEFSLPQELLSVIKPGRRVEFEVEGIAGPDGQGEIAVIFPAIDEATRSFKCRVIVPNGDLRFRPGLLATVRVVEQEVSEALVIPRSALRQVSGAWEVTVEENGQPVARRVETGLIAEDLAQITRGLNDGARVLVPEGTRN